VVGDAAGDVVGDAAGDVVGDPAGGYRFVILPPGFLS
jgi:hypothetical protein